MSSLIGRRTELLRCLAGVDGDGGVVLSGPAGAGKTVLLTELVSRLRRSGWSVVDLQASAATSGIPLWPFFPLLAGTAADSRPALADGIRARLAEATGPRTLLVVDDAHHLDPESVVMLRALVGSDVSILGAVRSGETLPDGLEDLWADADVVEILPFGPKDIEALTEAVLGAPASPALNRTVARESKGNPLFVRELLLDAVDAGQVRRDGEVWEVDGSAGGSIASPTDRTLRFLERRLARLDDDAVRLLRLVSTADTLRWSRVPHELQPSVDHLEARQLIARLEGDDARLVPDHPLVGEAVTGAMTESVRWSTLRDLVALVRADDDAHPGDPIRVADWATEAGIDLEVDEWVAATREALRVFDVGRAVDWARAAVTSDGSSHGAYRSLGEALRLDGSLAEAATAFRSAASCATAEDDVAATAVDRAALLGFQLGEPEAAIRVLHEAADAVDDPLRSASLRSEAGVMGTLLGRFEDVLLTRPTEAELAAADSATRWLFGLNEIYARTMLGRVADIDETVDVVWRDYEAVAGERPHELDLLVGLRGAARLQRGELVEGIAELQPIVEDRRSRGGYRGISSAVLALLMEMVADPRASEFAADAVDQHEWLDPFGSAPIALAAATLAAASAGHPDGTRQIVAGARDTHAGSEPWLSIWIGRAEARVAWESGDDRVAVDSCIDAGTVALETNHFAYGATVLHDAVRYGAADAVLPLLRDAVAKTDGGDLLEMLLAHAAAVCDGDADDLLGCADAFHARSAYALAVDAHRQRAVVLSGSDDHVAARHADLAGQVIARRANLHHRMAPAEIDDALTDREIEIALLAAAGRRSREISVDEFISVRTVDNHLRAVYRKLGVEGREELSALLGTPPA